MDSKLTRLQTFVRTYTPEEASSTFEMVNAASPEHLRSIAEGMARDGWIGPPLVAWGNQLLVGSHRFLAAVLAKIDIPVVRLDEHAGELFGSEAATWMAADYEDWREEEDSYRDPYDLFIGVAAAAERTDPDLATYLGLTTPKPAEDKESFLQLFRGES